MNERKKNPNDPMAHPIILFRKDSSKDDVLQKNMLLKTGVNKRRVMTTAYGGGGM